MKNQREIENPMVLPQFPFRKPVVNFGLCQCGCNEIISDEYPYIRWEDMYFNDRSCLIKFMTVHAGLEEVG